jgi:hypothetical protein
MGVERRKDERIRCAIPCQVSSSGKPVDGTVRNVSAGGLSVQVEMQVDQGDVLSLVLQPNRRDAIPVQAIVWHNRQVKQRKTGEVSQRLGLVLSDAPEDFGDLLGLPQTGAAKSSAPPEPEPVVAREAPARSKPSPKKPRGPVAKKTRADTAAKTKTAPPSEPPRQPGLPRPDRFRIRVKMDAGPRTRSILVFARDEDEARQNALDETGAGWAILEIERA